MKDFACTGGYHWHHGDICYHFGVEGAVDNECKGRTNGNGQSHGFSCGLKIGKDFNISNELILKECKENLLKQ